LQEAAIPPRKPQSWLTPTKRSDKSKVVESKSTSESQYCDLPIMFAALGSNPTPLSKSTSNPQSDVPLTALGGPQISFARRNSSADQTSPPMTISEPPISQPLVSTPTTNLDEPHSRQ
jgi:hypothetical protein